LILLKPQILDFKHIPARLTFLAINLQADMKSEDMNNESNVDELIEEFLASTSIESTSAREQYLQRETLYSLARLAKSEQLLMIRQSVDKLIPSTMRPVRRLAKGRRNGQGTMPGQAHLAFGRQE
jgi:hypothetical protein